MMPRAQRAFVIAMCAVIGGAFAYAACDWGHWPRITYLPVTAEFTLRAPADAIAIGYLGTVAWGLGGAICGALAGTLACAAIRRPLPGTALQLAGAWAITAIVLAGGYYTWTLWPW